MSLHYIEICNMHCVSLLKMFNVIFFLCFSNYVLRININNIKLKQQHQNLYVQNVSVLYLHYKILLLLLLKHFPPLCIFQCIVLIFQLAIDVILLFQKAYNSKFYSAQIHFKNQF